MLKKDIRIIKRVLNTNHEDLSKIGYSGGYYYAIDGFRMVRMEERPELPVFEKNEKHPNYETHVRTSMDTDYQCTLEIPYTVKQIKEWKKNNNRIAFKLGVKCNVNKDEFYIGINPQFLIDAMETTGSNKIKIPTKMKAMIMEGKGFTWFIMPVELLEKYYSNTEGMTVIETEE